MIDLSAIDGFDWDAGNREKNWKQHRVAWTEAEEAFLTDPSVLMPDSKHSLAEPRLALLSKTLSGRNLAIVFTIRNKRIRVISARDMSKKERRKYDEEIEEDT